MRFRKKPLAVEAIQLFPGNVEEVRKVIGAAEARSDSRGVEFRFLPEGARITCGFGEVYVDCPMAGWMSADAFSATYEPADTPTPSAGEEVQAVSALYQELLMAVVRKWPNESRHETALRYIREAERQEATTAKSTKPAPSGGRGGA